MNGRVVLLGATGMLGRAMRLELEARGASYDSRGRTTVDLSRPETMEGGIPDDTRWVVNCAAFTDVDAAEADPAVADAINGHGVGALAERCREIGATLVTFGTDYVFDGKARAPYRVDHPRAPTNAYGRSKALGESLVEASGVEHLSIRTSWLYAPWGKNFVLTMARLTRDRDTLRVVDDQWGRPTSVRHLARTTLALVERGAEGTFHVTDGDECTWFGLACLVRDHLGHECELEPCTTAEFPRPAKRPAYSVLDLSGTEALVGAMPSYRRAVKLALDEAHSETSAT